MKLNKNFKTYFLSYAASFFVLYFLICMITNPSLYISKSLDGLSAWAFNVLPSVLPFMFFTKVLSVLDIMPKLTRPFAPISQKLFNTPPISFYTFVMAILSGYPVGAKMVADLYLQGKITKNDAFKMTSFCSTSGPMFIVGAVGAGMFKSIKIGYILFLSHAIGAILNGLIYRNLKIKNEKQQAFDKPKQSFNIAEIITNSTLSILCVGCVIVVFFIIIETLSPILSLLSQNLAYFCEGLIEITKGCLDLSTLGTILSIILTSFVIGFGGISTLLQSLTMISKLKMPVWLFTLQKFTHAILSAILTCVLVFLV